MELPGVLAAAALLGVTHAIEPDHAAGIAALTAERDRRRAAVVGACFAAGHVLLVLVWVGVGALLLSGLPRTGLLDAVGETVLGVVLLAVGAVSAWRGFRSLRGDDAGHRHPTPTVPATDGGVPAARRYLGLGVVGALFTLSPPLSMLAFVAGVLPTATPGSVLGVVGAYAVGIVVVMTAVGAAVGMAFDTLRHRGTEVHATGQLLTALVVGALGASVLLGVV